MWIIQLFVWGIRRRRRRRKVRQCVSKEAMLRVSTLSEFPLDQAFANSACNLCVALILSPGMPLLNLVAVASLIMDYGTMWVIFLRASRRPPYFDELVAQACAQC